MKTEDRRHQECEQKEIHPRRDLEEAEERCECRLEHQLQNLADMMQMVMISMMDGPAKRKRTMRTTQRKSNEE